MSSSPHRKSSPSALQNIQNQYQIYLASVIPPNLHMSNQCYWKGKVESSEELSALQPTADIPKWRGISQPGPKSNLTRGRRRARRPPKRISRRPPNNRPILRKKMRKTPVAYPWNALVALGMEEAN